jgi:hypothetical protein
VVGGVVEAHRTDEPGVAPQREADRGIGVGVVVKTDLTPLRRGTAAGELGLPALPRRVLLLHLGSVDEPV